MKEQLDLLEKYLEASDLRTDYLLAIGKTKGIVNSLMWKKYYEADAQCWKLVKQLCQI